MNILAINGSPKGKRSNTWRLTSAFLQGIATQEEHTRGKHQRSKLSASVRLPSSPAWAVFRAGERRRGSAAFTTICRGLSINSVGRCCCLELSSVLLWVARFTENPHRPPASYVSSVHEHRNGKRRTSFSLRHEWQTHRGYFYVRFLYREG